MLAVNSYKRGFGISVDTVLVLDEMRPRQGFILPETLAWPR